MTETELLAWLSRISLLNNFSEKNLRFLAGCLQEKIFEAQETVFQEGDPGHGLFIMKSGKVTVSKRNQIGKDAIVATLADFGIFGDYNLIHEQAMNVTLTSLQTSHFLYLDRADFRKVLQQSPDALQDVFDNLAERIKHTNQELINLAMDNHPDMVLVTDPEFKLTAVNRQARHLLNIDPDVPPSHAVSSKMSMLLGKVRAVAHDHKPFFVVLLKPEKLFLWVHVNQLKDKQGMLQGYILELRDITQTRDKSRRDLEIASFIIHRFPELTEKMQELSKTLPRENPSTAEFLETIREVNRQVNKMMAFTELEAGPLRIQRMPINLEDLITEVCEAHQELAQERQVTVKTEFGFGEGLVDADDDWLKKLVSILLENALMYSENGNEVSIQTEKNPDGRFRCRIINTTDFTLDVEQAHRYFDLRTQLEEFESFLATDFSLELPLARHIVEAHSGVIFIEPNRENLFSVVFDI